METIIDGAQDKTATLNVGEAVVKLVREIRVNYRGPRVAPTTPRSPDDASAFIRKLLPDNSREHFVVLYLDGAHQIICYAVISTGCANACPVQPREVFQRAVMTGAVAIIAGHNHPSGILEPSLEDAKITRCLKSGGELLGIKLLDHIIVGTESFYSFNEKGAL